MQFLCSNHASCSTHDNDEEKTCNKEKCLLSYSQNTPVFVLFTSNFILNNIIIFIPKKETTIYHKIFISHYFSKFWQPPELL